MQRREFIKGLMCSIGALSLPLGGRALFGAPSDPIAQEKKSLAGIPEFNPPKDLLAVPQTARCGRVVLVRYGGGVRREETIGKKTESPFFHYGLMDKGTLYSDILINRSSITGHAQGTLYISTGRFDNYQGKPFDTEYTPHFPTLSEYVRSAFKSAPIDAVLINNSDNMSTELLGFSDHSEYGVTYGPILLSEWVLNMRRLERKLSGATGENHRQLQQQMNQQRKFMYRESVPDDPRINELLDRLDQEYGEQPPLGDDLVAELTIRALLEWKPRYLQVHLQDSDYVHWGPQQLYQRGIRRMDRALDRIWGSIQNDKELKDNTVLVMVPDHGRNMHGSRRIPYQHHDTEDPGSHRIFAFFAGPGIPQGQKIDEVRPQIDVAATVGALLGIACPYIHGRCLEEVLV